MAARLDALADELQAALPDAVKVRRETFDWGRSVWLTPTSNGGLGLWWFVSAYELILVVCLAND